MKCDNLCGFSLPLVPAAAAPTQRKGKVYGVFLGGGQLCCPLGEPKGTHQDLCLKDWAPATFLLAKPAKKVNGASLKSARVTLRCPPHLCWGLLYHSQANHMPNTSNPSAHHPNHQWRWVRAIKEDCEEGLQACFCWSWASFTASGESLLVNTCHLTEALDSNSWEQALLLVLTPPGSMPLSQTLWASIPSNIL